MALENPNQNNYVTQGEFQKGIKELSDKMDHHYDNLHQALHEETQTLHKRINDTNKTLSEERIKAAVVAEQAGASQKLWERVFWVLLTMVAGAIGAVIFNGGAG